LNDTNPKTDEPTHTSLIIAVLIIFTLWVGSGLVLFNVQERGTFGDMFGAVNALFSGLAFAAIIYTINLQRSELRLQRLELGLTRAELQGQKLELLAQNNLMRADSFEASFFRVLTVLNEITSSINIRQPIGGVLVGRDCFSFFYRFILGRLGSLEDHQVITDQQDNIQRSYAEFFQTYQGDVGHYFRTLYNLIKFVDESKMENKRFYTNLVRAQLSSQELLMLFYNCLTPIGSEKFKPLVERYALLKSLPVDKLASASHADLYSSTAFGDQ